MFEREAPAVNEACTLGYRPFVEGAVAVLTLDFDLCQRGTRQVAVAVHVHRGVAVLAQHAAFRVLRTGFHLVVQVVLDEQVVLGMQLRLLATLGVVR